MAGLGANVVSVAGAVGSRLALSALGTTIQFLDSKYQKA
jgi:hypothetical protein